MEYHGGLDAYIRKVESEKIHVEPLVIRANAGEWIEVTLHNLFDPSRPVRYFDYPRVPLDVRRRPSR